MTLGEFDDPMPFKGQEYKALKKSLQKSGTQFEDNFFKPDLTSLSLPYNVNKTPGWERKIVWKQPHQIASELNKKPRFFVNGASPADCLQGPLGNCGFVAGCSIIADDEELWSRVIPDWKEQEWDERRPEKHPGIFHFRFYRHGDWFDVVVDDQLPCWRLMDGTYKNAFIHSQTDNEFWSALLEKGFAKLNGSYGALVSRHSEEAVIAFTGGIAETIHLGVEDEQPCLNDIAEHFRIMEKELNRNSLLISNVDCSYGHTGNKSAQGILREHAYSISNVSRIPVSSETKRQYSSSEVNEVRNINSSGEKFLSQPQEERLFMIKLRNPHGSGEWNGRFSDSSDDWNKISSAWKSENNLQFANDGEFWMLFNDFCKYFDTVTVCRRVNKSFFSPHKKYYEAVFHGAWGSGRCGGSSRGNSGLVHENPQYIFDVEKENGDEDVMIYLEQKNPQCTTIGVTVLKVELNRKFRLQHIKYRWPRNIMSGFKFSQRSGVFTRRFFKQGRYLIIPCTEDRGMMGNFLLRLFTSEANHAMELTHESGASGLSCIRSAPLVTRIHVFCVEGLKKQNGSKLYCVISYDSKTVRTRTVDYFKDNAEWNESCIFYTYNLTKPIKVVVYNEGQMKDDYIGKTKVNVVEPFDFTRLSLTDCKKLKERPVDGVLTVSIENNKYGY